MSDETQDLETIRRLQRGDRAAVGELYDRHAPLMYGVVLRIVRERAEADDVLQEAWIQAWQRSGSFDPERGSVAGWLVTIARSRALDRIRRRASRAKAEANAPLPEPREDPGLKSERGADRSALGRAMAALDPRHREVLEVAYFEGLSQSEIAERLAAPLGTVKHWARQGLLRLRELMPRDEES
ncbi:MAG: sigma-70 family RNA polymerase sigma factor [Candidatus Eisenbacteria bacterium]